MTEGLYKGDCLDMMRAMEPESVDAIVTDPPYGLAFMGKDWDHGVPGVEFWREALRVAKPGAHLLAFGGTRTYHRLACAIEDAGWEVRDCLQWVYGCLSDDTELLMDGRWVRYQEAIVGGLAMCYDVDRGELSWQPIQEVLVYAYSDTAYRVVSAATDQLVTRNHRCLVERGGTTAFVLAEDAAREREARVPVLEDLQGLLEALQLRDEGAGHAEEDLLAGMRECFASWAPQAEAYGGACGHGAKHLCYLRRAGMEAESMDQEEQGGVLLAPMCREAPGGGVGQARAQELCCEDTRWDGLLSRQDDRAQQPCMERWGDLLPQTRELQANQVHPLSCGVPSDGSQGRLCDGASPACGDGDGEVLASSGSGASPEPRSAGQPAGEPGGLREQQGPQVVRASRFARSDLARFEPVHYRGVVWCLRVPTGAFVARRNGKVFITGNSGFPKSLDVSKALDAEAGAEREVVGKKAVTCGTGEAFGKATGTGHKGTVVPITAPATDLAREWAGWGTALKPAYEPVIWARKRLTVVPQWRTMAQEVQRKVGAVLCLLLSDARSVEWLSRSNQSVCGEASDSALWIAAVLRGGEFVEWREAMATFSSPETVSTCLSIAWSWSEFLGDLSTPENMSTMSTETDPTTALRTLNSCLSALIPPCIIEAVCRLDGCESSAPGAESSSIGGAERTSSTPGDTAAALATLHRAVTSASTVVDSLRVAARVADSALRDATQRLGKQGRVGPATEYEPIILARKPLCGTVARNVALHGTGALNIDATRVAGQPWASVAPNAGGRSGGVMGKHCAHPGGDPHPYGRWPANLLLSHAPGCRKVGVRKVQGTHGVRCQRGDATATSFAMGGSGEEVGYADADGMETVAVWECVTGCPVAALDEMSGERAPGRFPGVQNSPGTGRAMHGGFAGNVADARDMGDHGGASRFFTTFEPEVPFLYCPKASRAERNAGLDGLPLGEAPGTKRTEPAPGRQSAKGAQRQNVHPTVKPLAVVEWLLKLATREGALVLDPFLGSGTTAVACIRLGRRWAGAEITPEYWPIIEARVAHAERTRQPELFGGEVC